MKDDILTRIREKAVAARDAEQELKDLEERLKETKNRLNHIYHEELPDLMFEAGVDEIGIPASGNLPAMVAKLGPYYQANIATGWPEERRTAAFNWLDNNKHGDLIKTEISILLPRGKREEAQKLIKQLSKYGPSIKQSVPFQTLTAWLKDLVESGKDLPPLEVIGGTVGQVVKLKERKD